METFAAQLRHFANVLDRSVDNAGIISVERYDGRSTVLLFAPEFNRLFPDAPRRHRDAGGKTYNQPEGTIDGVRFTCSIPVAASEVLSSEGDASEAASVGGGK